MIKVEELTKRYDDRVVLDRLSFTAPAGTVTGLLGPNGAGKTTMFRLLLGLAEPTAGSALIDGRSYRDLPSPRRTVGAVLESTGLHPGRSGRNHLRVIATAAGLPLARVDELLELVGLVSAADRRVGGYSLGMQQRLALAAALLGDPAVIALDEPTNGLDPEGVAWLRRMTRAWAAEGRCVVVASHLLAAVSRSVDRVVIIDGGRVVHHETLDDEAGGAVTVACDNPAELAAALEREGADVKGAADGALDVRGADARRVGEIAAAAEVIVHHLGIRSDRDRLEALFISLTAKDRP